ALRNAVAVGADPDHIALIDNFCWGDPKNPEQLWTLLRAAKGCYDAALMFGTPFVSGKDSFNNEFADASRTRVAVPPSLLISAFGVVPDIGKSVTSDLKKAGNLLYLVGEFRPTIAASVFADIFAGDDVGAVRGRAAKGFAAKGSAAGGPGPGISRQAPKTFRKIFEAMQSSLVFACHDLSDGGLGAALSEMCIGGGKGAVLDMHAIESFGSSIATPPANAEERNPEMSFPLCFLFGETNGCFLAEVEESSAAAFEAILGDVPFVRAGKVADRGALELVSGERTMASINIERLAAAYSGEGANP
ncbi:MAG: hypothetical protein LLF89_10250, partial [Spirochaetaceae bacterium]|nr:hypothetical protein [Spirochaetaceae bacterium]